MTGQNKFSVGEIVVYKNHPLLYDYSIKGDGKYVPPIMVVKEVIFENEKKRTHDETTGLQIAEKIKYICTYFDDNKSEFIESHLYQSMLEKFTFLHIGRIDDPDALDNGHVNLVDEIAQYPLSPTYEYGKIVYFKTKKLELLKKRISKSITKPLKKKVEEKDIEKKVTFQYVVNYATPEFIICGHKTETQNDLFYNDGSSKRLVSNELLKIQWYNPIHQKFSEQFLPIECFCDIQPFETNRLHLEAKPHHKPVPAVHFDELPHEKSSEEFPKTI